MFKFPFPSFQTDNKLDLLVENLGRVNFVKFERKSTFDDQYKGTFFFYFLLCTVNVIIIKDLEM